MEIEVLHRQGNCIREIAQEMGIARNTVRAIFARRTQDQYDPREPRPSKLDPYKPHLHERLEEASKIELHATVLLREIQARGYDGGITQLKEYLRLIRPTVDQVPVIRFETEPGKQLQIDFVVFRRGAIETLAASLEHASAFFGSVPEQVLCDNPNTVVIERNAYGEGKHHYNPYCWKSQSIAALR